MFREYQGNVDEDIGLCSSSSVKAVSGISRDVNVSGGSQQSNTKDSPVPPHVNINSDEKSGIEKTSSPDSASNIELQTYNTVNEEMTSGQGNQELLDEVPLEKTPINDIAKAGDLEVSSDTVEVGTISSNTLKTVGKDMTIIEVTASVSSPSEEDASEAPELLDKSIGEEEDDEDYVELKVDSSPSEEASLPTELQGNSLSPHTTEVRERLDMFSNDQKLTFQEKEPVSKKQADTETQDSKDAGSSATSPDTTASQTMQSDIGQMLDEGKKTTDVTRETKASNDAHGNVLESPTTFEQKIARLDVSSVATDTERLELKASTNVEAPQPLPPVLEVIMSS